MTVHYSHPRDDFIVLRLWSDRDHIDLTEADLADVESAVRFARERIFEESTR